MLWRLLLFLTYTTSLKCNINKHTVFPYIPKSPYDKLVYELESIRKQSLNTNHTEPNTHKENPNPSLDMSTNLKET